MIRFAVQRPEQRKGTIMNMVKNLQWDQDRYLAHFGIKINPKMPMVPAKILQNPVIQYGNRTVDPKMTGRWDLRNIKFVSPNKVPLKSWAMVIMDGSVDKPTADNFARVFKSAYAGHGGKIEGGPVVITAPIKMPHDIVVQEAYNTCGRTFKQDPQLIFFILKDKSSMVYDRLKKNTDCRWGVLSQMVSGLQVKSAAPQYCSNVCMKVNAKLGGQTSRIVTKDKGAPSAFFKVPTMMIGVDVSHGNTGASSASTAAMCVSMDPDAALYDAAVQTNGWGVEILQPANMHSMLGPLAVKWRTKNGRAPQHVFYMRDGVSEGQYAHVMEFEVGEMRKVFQAALGVVPKITVIICTKRHHIRFFPERGDKNKNCLPGTLVEKEVTHPFHYDFYLCSHVAIQGTARPVHYNVLFDECALKPDDLQRILYHQCYQYCRSTTPVSLHPAVYYAHLAGARARHHEDFNSTEQIVKDSPHMILSRPGLMAKGDTSGTTTSRDDSIQPAHLMRIGSGNQKQGSAQLFKQGMWWV
jgi:eukaryotic translation initiation factor 2C